MEGIGAVTTSSPTSPTTACPCGSNAATAHPKPAHWISPTRTGSVGQPSTNAVHTSVPPLTDESTRSLETCSYTQAKPSLGRGAPVLPTALMLLRSKSFPGDSSAFWQLVR